MWEEKIHQQKQNIQKESKKYRKSDEETVTITQKMCQMD